MVALLLGDVQYLIFLEKIFAMSALLQLQCTRKALEQRNVHFLNST